VKRYAEAGKLSFNRSSHGNAFAMVENKDWPNAACAQVGVRRETRGPLYCPGPAGIVRRVFQWHRGDGAFVMNSFPKRLAPVVIAAALIGTVPAPAAPAPAPVPAPGKIVLAPHRAIYDLRLLRANRTGGIDSVRGRIVYDFSGSACEGYALRLRQMSELDSGEGDVLSDLRSTTWEDSTAKRFRFNSENLLNDKRTDMVVGHADRTPAAVRVTLNQPETKRFSVPAGAVFPTEHTRRIIAAARAGKTILTFPVYDGSDNGEKVYNTITVIGKPIAPGVDPPADAGAKIPALSHLTRWPVSIGYFEKESEALQHSGEQTPVYGLSFELYENGVSRALVLDYKDFTLKGDLTGLEMKKAKACK
jgi:hypothetical protein